MPDAQNNLPRIALVSVARSGTTHLVRLAEAFEDLYVVKNEWLEGVGIAWAQPAELEAFRRLNGVDYTDHNDARLRTWVRANKEKTLEVLEGLAKPTDKAVFYKSFPSHVAAPDFDRLFYDRPDTRFVFLMRRPIDCFVSLVKAQMIDHWVSTDTTSIKPDLDADLYLNWYALSSDWFLTLKGRLDKDNRTYGTLSYEEDVMPGIDHLLGRVQEEFEVIGFETRINRAHVAKTHAKRLVSKLRGKEIHGNLGAVKQDTESKTSAKVSNWDKFTQDIIARTGSLECLEQFTPQEQQVFWGELTLPPEFEFPTSKGV